MDIKNAALDVKGTCGSQFVLTGLKPIYRYEDGKRVGDPTGYTYKLVLPERMYETLNVQIDGPQQVEIADKPVPVKLENLDLEIRWNPSIGNYIMGLASRIMPIGG